MRAPHRPVAHAELDREIDRDPDEQDPEADRHQVQGADRSGGEQQGQHQPESERCQDRHDQPPRSDRQKQPQRNQHDAADQAGDRPLGDAREFLVGERDVAGDADARIARFDEFELGGSLADRLCRRPAGLDRPEVEHRLQQDELVRPAQLCDLAADQSGPGQWLRIAGERLVHRPAKRRQRRSVGRQIDLRLDDPSAQQLQRGEQPARTRVAGELPEERLGVDRAFEKVGELLRIEKEQPLLLQEMRSVGAGHATEMGMVGGQRLG